MTLDERIRGEIEARIRSGALKPGDRIPFEHELVADYGCARATVSKALTALSRAGLIERRRRAGSFVARPHIHSPVLDVPDIGQVIMARGDAYRFALQDRRIRLHHADDPIDTSGEVLALDGVHHAAGEPFGHEQRLIALHAVPDASDTDFTATAPGSWLLDHVAWSDARHRIAAVPAEPKLARLLGIKPGTACLELERWTWRTGTAITWVRQTFPGDRYDLVAEFQPR
jgi:GntR family histidine utilization transcriptional repressor